MFLFKNPSNANPNPQNFIENMLQMSSKARLKCCLLDLYISIGETIKLTFQGFHASPGDRKWYLFLKMQSVIAGAGSYVIWIVVYSSLIQ